MRIISKYRDFYDGLGGSDRENLPLYTRQTSEEHVSYDNLKRVASLQPFWDFASRVPWCDAFDGTKQDSHYNRTCVETLRIAFCGKAYFFYIWDNRPFATVMDLEAYVRGLPEDKTKYPTSYSDGAVRESGRQALVKAFDEAQNKRVKPSFIHWNKPRVNAEGWAQSGIAVTDMPAELFRQEGSPILYWGTADDQAYRRPEPKSGRYLTKNPCLQSLRLERVWDPTWVWQELDMYLGNQMATQFDPASARTDELARDYHGFDEYSFKNTAPGQKKVRRRENKQRKRHQEVP